MAESESGQEKTEMPTPKKLQDLMESGQFARSQDCLLYTSPSPRDKRQSRMPSSA